jgi:hypothetical protein
MLSAALVTSALVGCKAGNQLPEGKRNDGMAPPAPIAPPLLAETLRRFARGLRPDPDHQPRLV